MAANGTPTRNIVITQLIGGLWLSEMAALCPELGFLALVLCFSTLSGADSDFACKLPISR